MDKEYAIALIDGHKNKLIDPVEMLDWTWLRVILHHMDTNHWDLAVHRAERVLSQ